MNDLEEGKTYRISTEGVSGTHTLFTGKLVGIGDIFLTIKNDKDGTVHIPKDKIFYIKEVN